MDDEQQQVKASNPSACGSSTPVEGSFTWQGDQTVSFTPNAALEPGTYALQVTDAAKNNQEQTLEPIGPLTIVELPFDALMVEGEQHDLILLTPYYDRETYGRGPVFRAEVRITLTDGTEYLFPYPYASGDVIPIDNLLLKNIFAGDYLETFRISVQVMRYKDALNQSDQIEKLSSFSLSTQAATEVPEWNPNNVPRPEIIEGLFRLDLEGVTEQTLANACSATSQSLVTGMKRVTSAEDSTLSNGKTPLLLIHGWNELGNSMATAFNDAKIQKSKMNPALCYWKSFITNFFAESSSAGLSILHEEYELYSFGYDTSLPVACNGVGAWQGQSYNNSEHLAASLKRSFPNHRVVILAHSMGGLVTNTVVQTDSGASARIKHVVTGGTPYTGSAIMLCNQTDGVRCVDARINYGLFNEALFLLAETFGTAVKAVSPEVYEIAYKISRYEGSADLSWEHGGFELFRSLELCDKIIDRFLSDDCELIPT